MKIRSVRPSFLQLGVKVMMLFWPQIIQAAAANGGYIAGAKIFGAHPFMQLKYGHLEK
jgi:hypothetical protein